MIDIKENEVYKTKTGDYIHVKEITYYNTTFLNTRGEADVKTKSIASIVTGGISNNESDSTTNVRRQVWDLQFFRDLIEENKWTFSKNCAYSLDGLQNIRTYIRKVKDDLDATEEAIIEDGRTYVLLVEVESILDKRLDG